MNFQTSVKTCFAKYASFKGRASRSEFWWFYLFICLVMLAAGVLPSLFWDSAIFVYLSTLAFVLPYLSVSVRRLHDIGKSGWYYFVTLIPFIGNIVLLVFYCTASQPFPNKYGDAPVCK